MSDMFVFHLWVGTCSLLCQRCVSPKTTGLICSDTTLCFFAHSFQSKKHMFFFFENQSNFQPLNYYLIAVRALLEGVNKEATSSLACILFPLEVMCRFVYAGGAPAQPATSKALTSKMICNLTYMLATPPHRIINFQFSKNLWRRCACVCVCVCFCANFPTMLGVTLWPRVLCMWAGLKVDCRLMARSVEGIN